MVKQNNKMFLYMFFGMLSPNRACIWDIFVPTGSFGQFLSKTMTDFPGFSVGFSVLTQLLIKCCSCECMPHRCVRNQAYNRCATSMVQICTVLEALSRYETCLPSYRQCRQIQHLVHNRLILYSGKLASR